MKTTEWEGEAATSEIIDRGAAVPSAIIVDKDKVADEIAAATTALDAAKNVERMLRRYWRLMRKEILQRIKRGRRPRI